MGLFDKTINELARQARELDEKHPEVIEEYKRQHPELSGEYVVKCPTCGFPKVRRISSIEKVGNALTLGYFGNKRKKQFECLNPKCKYRW